MKKRTKILFTILIIIAIGLILPQDFKMPVENATKNDFNKDSFWHYPWGKSITHKGVDIFAKKGTKINSSVSGLVLYAGEIPIGGEISLIIGPKWRIHYYAHMKDNMSSTLSWVNQGTTIGTIGTSGNAKGKAPHLHYSILTPIPYFLRYDYKSRQGWKKMFYLNPIDYLIND
ncbi:M23 family metallopeptidase [Flavicella sp.]|uniref:M23 family metallopeptidase n=1 Tax=Flavicella sp. TaxID=2957742 RepID=UPI003016DD7B